MCDNCTVIAGDGLSSDCCCTVHVVKRDYDCCENREQAGMRHLALQDLPKGQKHILSGIIPGAFISRGALNFKRPGERSHDVGCVCPACDGKGRHVHPDDAEVFVIMQGKARIEVDGVSHPLVAGDVVICEPGEDHHLVSDEHDPCVNLYLHAGDVQNPRQQGA